MTDKKKETLLKEGTVRRFMKLAEIEPLTKSFFEHFGQEDEALEEIDVGPTAGAYDRDEEELEVDLPMDEPGEAELDVELAPEEEPLEDAGEITLTDEEVTSLVTAFDAAEDVVQRLRSAGDAVEPEELEAPDMDVEDMEAVELAPDEVSVEDEELAEVEVVDEDTVVNEVANRVAARLLSKNKKKR